MKRARFSVLMLTMTIALGYGATNPTPITSIGSNPYFSTELYPQDIMLRSGSYLFYSPNYQNKPYWGDVDEPGNKPNSTTDYTVTSAEIEDDDGSFNHSGKFNSIANNLGYAHRFSDNLMTSLDVDYKVDALRNTIGGDMTGDSLYTVAGGRLPFSYSSSHTLNRLNVRAMLGSLIRDVPFGIQLNGSVNNTISLKHTMSFSKLAKLDNLNYESGNYLHKDFSGDQARLLWGASNVGCSHPFRITGTQGDMWKQDDYAVGPLYNLNLLGGITLPKVKGGLNIRYTWGHQDQYSWETDYSRFSSSDSIDRQMAENFIGSYVKSDRARVTSAGEGKLLGNIHWREGDRFALNTFAAIGYLDSTSGYAPSGNLKARSTSKEKMRSIELEFDPNISVKLGEFLNYVDGAILFRYRYSRYNNTDGVGVFRESTVQRGGWEDSQEECSYANENAVDLGADLATMFPLFSRGPHHLSLNLRLFGDVRFTFQNKHYGENDTLGLGIFTQQNIRHNFAREVMFNTSLMLHYIQGPYHLRLQFTQPMLYSIAPRTSVTDTHRNIVDDGNKYPLKKSALWITKDGISVALYASYDMVLPFLQSR